MEKGYQIIELEFLEPLYRNQVSFNVIIPILLWLSHKVNEILREKSLKVEIEIIKVSYEGNYPALGAHYLEQSFRKIKDDEDIEDLVIELCEKFTRELPLSEFLDYQANYREKIEISISEYYDCE